MSSDTIAVQDDFKKLYDQEQKKVAALEQRLALYEQNGDAKLYYALNRKASEMADLLNKTRLAEIDLDNKDGKTFERMRTI